MKVKTEAERQGLHRIGALVGETLQLMGAALKPGLSTAELDALGAAHLTQHGARSAPQHFYRFPGATCISLAPAVAHGIPGPYLLKAGDLINIDVSAELDGFVGDTGSSFVVPGADTPEARAREQLCRDGREIHAEILAQIKAGMTLARLGQVIQECTHKRGYTLIQNLCSHGVGRTLHEEPRQILPYPDWKDKRKLTEGLVITIEPFISRGADQVYQDSDGWTLIPTRPHDTVQYEHSLIVTAEGCEILTHPPQR